MSGILRGMYHSRKIKLPSGRVVEITYWGDSLDSLEGKPPMLRCDVCQECGSDLVQLTSLSQHGTTQGVLWALGLACPECFDFRTTLIDEEELDVFEELMDGATEELEILADHLFCEEWESFIDLFVEALEQDLISAEDFA